MRGRAGVDAEAAVAAQGRDVLDGGEVAAAEQDRHGALVDEPVGVRAGAADGDVGEAVAVDVAEPGRAEAEAVAFGGAVDAGDGGRGKVVDAFVRGRRGAVAAQQVDGAIVGQPAGLDEPGADQQVRQSVAVEIGEGDGLAEPVVVVLAGEIDACQAGRERKDACGLEAVRLAQDQRRHACVAAAHVGRPDDDVVEPVAVEIRPAGDHMAGALRTVAEQPETVRAVQGHNVDHAVAPRSEIIRKLWARDAGSWLMASKIRDACCGNSAARTAPGAGCLSGR